MSTFCIDEEGKVRCACGSEYCHPIEVSVHTGNMRRVITQAGMTHVLERNPGDGVITRLVFACEECGLDWEFSLRFHEGGTYTDAGIVRRRADDEWPSVIWRP